MHLSATAFGGGVAEINYTLVPLMADAGLEVEWRIIRGADEFFNVTKAIHNALQGNPRSLTPEEQEIFRALQRAERARVRGDDYDFVIIHDPQPAAMIEHFPDSRGATGSGAATSTSRRRTRTCWTFLLPSIGRHDAAIFHLREYVPRRRRCREASSGRRRSTR